ncbi:MAG: hypothetical protein P1P83_02720 [Bacteroidales bacterium]|nr:hypothetical protein [Bacteroidales bacterium]MDT8373227.1 hypothetical protein [Bacteroidales bacterium]
MISARCRCLSLFFSVVSYLITSQANRMSATVRVVTAAITESDSSIANMISPPAYAASRYIDSRSDSFRSRSADVLNSASLD